MDSQGGEAWIGPYQVARELGRGGMGAVYLARDPARRDWVAVKVLNEGLVDEVDTGRFAREVEALTRVGAHPGIVGLVSAGSLPNGRPYLAMEYVEGEDLEHLLSRGLPPQVSLDYVWQVASALGSAHELGLVHRDVKPGNVLIDAQGRARIADFGLARLAETRERLTLTGELIGTPAYMAPEQIYPEGFGAIGPWTDVYALGALVYFALTGRSANGEGTAMVVAANVVHGQRAAPIEVARGDAWGRRVAPVLKRALALQAGERHASAAEFAADLRQALEAPEARGARRWPLWLCAGGALLLAGGAALGKRSSPAAQASVSAADSPTRVDPGPVFQAGETVRAREALRRSELSCPDAPAILLCSGELAAAVEAAGPAGSGLDPVDWARAAAELGRTELVQAALEKVPEGHVELLAFELGVPRASDPSDPLWLGLLEGARALRRGDLGIAGLGLARCAPGAEASGTPGANAAQAREWVRLSLQLALARADLAEAQQVWACWEAQGPLELARRAGWADVILSAAEIAEQPLPDSARLAESRAELRARGPQSELALAGAALRAGAGLAGPRVLVETWALLGSESERQLQAAELGVDQIGARRALPGLRLARAGNPERYALALARSQALVGELDLAARALEPAPRDSARRLFEARLAGQRLDAAGLALALTRAQGSRASGSELGQAWGAIAASLEDEDDSLLRLARAGALCEQLEHLGPDAPPELQARAVEELRALSGDPGPLSAARQEVAAALQAPELEPGLARVHQAYASLAEEAEALVAGPISPATRVEALRLLALRGEVSAAEAFMAIRADLPAWAWLGVRSAEAARSMEERASALRRVLALSLGRLGQAQQPLTAPGDLCAELALLDERSLTSFAATPEGLTRLGATLIDHPGATLEVLQLLAWGGKVEPTPTLAARDPAALVARALAHVRGEGLEPEHLRAAAVACGAAIRSSPRPLPGVHLLRALCLARLGPAARPDVERDLRVAEAALPWSHAPWRARLAALPEEDLGGPLDELTSRGGIRLDLSEGGSPIAARGLLAIAPRARAALEGLIRARQGEHAGEFGPRVRAALLLQGLNRRSAPRTVCRQLCDELEDPRLRAGTWALALRELARHDEDLATREEALAAAEEALWARPLGGAVAGSALALELRDQLPVARYPFFGGLLTSQASREVFPLRPGSSGRRWWREFDLQARGGLARLLRQGDEAEPPWSPTSLTRPRSLARCVLASPWDEDLNKKLMEQAPETGDWSEAPLALLRVSACAIRGDSAEVLVDNADRRVFQRAVGVAPAECAGAWRVLAMAVRIARELANEGYEAREWIQLRGLESESLLWLAAQAEDSAQAQALLQRAALADTDSKRNHRRASDRFVAASRLARLCVLLERDSKESLEDLSSIFRELSARERSKARAIAEQDPWLPRLLRDEAYARWIAVLRAKSANPTGQDGERR